MLSLVTESTALERSSAEEDELDGLWARTREGDRAATRELLERVAPAVFRVAAAVLGPGHRDVDDVVQLSLVAFLEALASFRGDCRIRYFASRVALRTALYARRRSRNEQKRVDAMSHDAELSAAPSAPGDRRSQMLEHLLSELPDGQAEALVLRVVLEYSLKEAAETMKVPVNTVRSRVRLAREALRKRIMADPNFAELREVIP
jgi:RNA polymerase sigma-70 factor, ECF subfamily